MRRLAELSGAARWSYARASAALVLFVVAVDNLPRLIPVFFLTPFRAAFPEPNQIRLVTDANFSGVCVVHIRLYFTTGRHPAAQSRTCGLPDATASGRRLDNYRDDAKSRSQSHRIAASDLEDRSVRSRGSAGGRMRTLHAGRKCRAPYIPRESTNSFLAVDM